MAVDPLHGIGRGERQRAREHLIERDAERIEVAVRIDRAVHPSRLLGRHIGQSAGNGFGRLERLSLARKPRGDAEAGEPHFTVGAVDQDIGGLEVLVDEAAVVGLAQGRGHADGDAQKGAGLDGLAEQPSERLSPRGPRAPAWSDRVRARARAAAPPRHCPTRLSVHIDGRGGRGSRARVVPQPGAQSARRAHRRRRSGAILGRRRIPHPPTGRGDSHPLALNREEGLISRTPPSRWRPPSIGRRYWRRVRLPP